MVVDLPTCPRWPMPTAPASTTFDHPLQGARQGPKELHHEPPRQSERLAHAGRHRGRAGRGRPPGAPGPRKGAAVTAFAYEVRVISWDRQALAWRPLEPAGRLVAPGIVQAKRDALALYGHALAPWQAL